MTQNEHTLIALIIMMILWNFFLRDYFVNPKDVERWRDYFQGN